VTIPVFRSVAVLVLVSCRIAVACLARGIGIASGLARAVLALAGAVLVLVACRFTFSHFARGVRVTAGLARAMLALAGAVLVLVARRFTFSHFARGIGIAAGLARAVLALAGAVLVLVAQRFAADRFARGIRVHCRLDAARLSEPIHVLVLFTQDPAFAGLARSNSLATGQTKRRANHQCCLDDHLYHLPLLNVLKNATRFSRFAKDGSAIKTQKQPKPYGQKPGFFQRRSSLC
jgi:hypothetical protein